MCEKGFVNCPIKRSCILLKLPVTKEIQNIIDLWTLDYCNIVDVQAERVKKIRGKLVILLCQKKIQKSSKIGFRPFGVHTLMGRD